MHAELPVEMRYTPNLGIANILEFGVRVAALVPRESLSREARGAREVALPAEGSDTEASIIQRRAGVAQRGVARHGDGSRWRRLATRLRLHSKR